MGESFVWRLSLRSSIDDVFAALTTDEGRARFWAEKTVESNGAIEFHFPNGLTHEAPIVEKAAPTRFAIRYFGANTAFALKEDSGETIVTVSVDDAPEDDWLDAYAGWISVLMNMKAVLDFGADLRNHDPHKSWDQRFIDN
ncbi:MAG: SRPBCC domain-containing protein [Pseudomonadota bacterium]